MRTFLSAILAHIQRNQHVYIFPLIAVGLIVGALYGIPLLTGRAVQDSPAVIVGFLYNFAGIIIAALAVGIIQNHLIGYRRSDGYDWHDTLCTFVLLVLFLYWVFR